MDWGRIIAFVVGFYFGMVSIGMMILAGRADEQLKRIGLVLVIIGLMVCAAPAWAGDKEELVLKQQLLQEKMTRYEIQFQLLQIQFKEAKEELAILNNRLAEIQKKEEAVKKAEPAKEEDAVKKPEAPKKEELPKKAK